ncbi:cysteine proteinase [Fomitiporia mediterranea MF3/22]|uniref:cysteine proteinase n=1 Tax=Fomitiporia mediterranea (strain MF3/22) TaxID=694068 RepID=UPI0004407AEF|nr:cysteine proteinase [Fomitiporia mediterranea MF3/22]EJD05549.1 cysteine proteinase [Fomitiporia mediterranea MF3/22]
MQALMGKSNKAPTPQELYRARKQKEEAERNSFLPPGLVNHGNTCFMNSVLQGLIATPMLADIVRFSLPDIYAPILSRRSPQLTNGHGQGGAAERDWEQGMPLGDIFVHLMLKAWNAQDERSHLSMSPKDLLSRIGAKFDQYLDFRQQDAHEFLRHLLDAMRMEELDIIKKRQPRPPKTKRRKSKNRDDSPRPSSSESLDIPEEDRLTSFVDMVFGGRLASILVCEKCKKISFTYEDFNDLSLPIKQEDYEKARKRDKLKSLARKLGMRGRGATRDLDSSDNPRSSSVPSSPLRRSEEAERSFELVLNDVGHRRRSLEAGEETPSLKNTFQEEEISQEAADVPYEQMVKDRHRALGVLEEGKVLDEDESQKEEPRREKDEDGWVKLRRKITVSMGVKKAKRKSGPKEAPSDLQSNDESQAEATGDEAMDSYVDVKAPSPSPASPAMSPLLGATNALQRLPFVRRPSSRVDSPSISAVTSPARSPDLPPVTLPPPELRPPSPTPAPAEPIRSKSPRPPKQSASEAAYLRRLLADVPSTSSTGFNLFRTSPLANSSPEISDARAAWPKLGHVQSVEGCLRLFTAVEVLDGENMVGCRRCWKIKNGVYNPSHEDAKRGEKDEEDEEEADADDNDERSSSSSASVKISLVDGDDSRPQGVPSASTGLQLSSLDIHERDSLRSAPPPSSNNRFLENDGPQAARLLNAGTSSSPSVNVPSISMTAPEPTHAPSASEQTPVAEVPPESALRGNMSARLISSPSRDSLQLPTTRHFRQPAERASSSSIASDTSSLSSDGSGDEAEETETSLAASVRSDSSSVRSNRLEMRTTKPNALSNSTIDHTSRSSMSRQRRKSIGGVPRAKQVVMRRAYKRYLISMPPPVLVIHLKRFQQVGRSPTQLQFFTNFKKLDDPVSFPEYLDLNPYLLPSRDGPEGKNKKKRSKEEKRAEENGRKDLGVVSEGCMYRLYAVIVHIGNMLGGHYVAYTALPEAAPSTKEDYSSISSSTSVDSVRPENPRTTSFTRTANPHPSSKSRTSSNNGSSAQRQWCYVSDTVVRLATLDEVLQAKAYICMYERI